MSELNAELTALFRKALFDEYPEWLTYLKDPPQGAANETLEVEIPQAGTGRALLLMTGGEEITLGFDAWHTHLGPFLGLSIEESVEDAMMMIRAFVNEETVVAISYLDGVWQESSFHYRVAPGERNPLWITKVFSWRQTYDAAVEPA
ncbi:hypothetical protein [Paludibaculum fermentans]|uniref:Uncharacterized protein n=1 Tax=Paludibaculum fermentans TaxID=1473598 RepID=A0A7S7NLZ5_PALFE|nr:hypothetical protein [Paludibaculum fermentans]QOY86038.1 hypothetical protein IRI77_24925 [Paludibaculum fermentans]